METKLKGKGTRVIGRIWALPSSLIILTLAALIVLTSCHSGVSSMATKAGSGVMASESRSLREFHSIVFEGRGSLYLTQGPEPGVVVETDDNLLDLYRTKVKDGVLHLGFKAGSLVSPTRVEVRLTAEQLDSVILNGSGRVVGMNTITGDELRLLINGSGDASLKTYVPRVWVRTNGSGDANLHLNAEELEVSSSGSGRVRLSGQADNQKVSLTGSGDYLADGLKNQTTRIRLAGSGDARLWVTAVLEASLRGSGNLYYKGSPEIDKQIFGSGKLKLLK
jgi:hypothetical protein